jgi:RimJ/RimL family protein N-acetyltransferase
VASLLPPDPPLDDEVVRLRPWTDDDVDQLVAACQDTEIQRFIPIPRPYGRDEAEAYVARTRRQWQDGSTAAFAIVDPDDPARVLGAINVAVSGPVGNSGYWVTPEARGRGVARRALRLVTAWAFEQFGLGVVLLEIRPQNAPSIAVAVSAGFHESGAIDVNTVTGEQHGLIFSRLASD